MDDTIDKNYKLLNEDVLELLDQAELVIFSEIDVINEKKKEIVSKLETIKLPEDQHLLNSIKILLKKLKDNGMLAKENGDDIYQGFITFFKHIYESYKGRTNSYLENTLKKREIAKAALINRNKNVNSIIPNYQNSVGGDTYSGDFTTYFDSQYKKTDIKDKQAEITKKTDLKMTNIKGKELFKIEITDIDFTQATNINNELATKNLYQYTNWYHSGKGNLTGNEPSDSLNTIDINLEKSHLVDGPNFESVKKDFVSNLIKLYAFLAQPANKMAELEMISNTNNNIQYVLNQMQDWQNLDLGMQAIGSIDDLTELYSHLIKEGNFGDSVKNHIKKYYSIKGNDDINFTQNLKLNYLHFSPKTWGLGNTTSDTAVSDSFGFMNQTIVANTDINFVTLPAPLYINNVMMNYAQDNNDITADNIGTLLPKFEKVDGSFNKAMYARLQELQFPFLNYDNTSTGTGTGKNKTTISTLTDLVIINKHSDVVKTHVDSLLFNNENNFGNLTNNLNQGFAKKTRVWFKDVLDGSTETGKLRKFAYSNLKFNGENITKDQFGLTSKFLGIDPSKLDLLAKYSIIHNEMLKLYKDMCKNNETIKLKYDIFSKNVSNDAGKTTTGLNSLIYGDDTADPNNYGTADNVCAGSAWVKYGFAFMRGSAATTAAANLKLADTSGAGDNKTEDMVITNNTFSTKEKEWFDLCKIVIKHLKDNSHLEINTDLLNKLFAGNNKDGNKLYTVGTTDTKTTNFRKLDGTQGTLDDETAAAILFVMDWTIVLMGIHHLNKNGTNNREYQIQAGFINQSVNNIFKSITFGYELETSDKLKGFNLIICPALGNDNLNAFGIKNQDHTETTLDCTLDNVKALLKTFEPKLKTGNFNKSEFIKEMFFTIEYLKNNADFCDKLNSLTNLEDYAKGLSCFIPVDLKSNIKLTELVRTKNFMNRFGSFIVHNNKIESHQNITGITGNMDEMYKGFTSILAAVSLASMYSSYFELITNNLMTHIDSMEKKLEQQNDYFTSSTERDYFKKSIKQSKDTLKEISTLKEVFGELYAEAKHGKDTLAKMFGLVLPTYLRKEFKFNNSDKNNENLDNLEDQMIGYLRFAQLMTHYAKNDLTLFEIKSNASSYDIENSNGLKQLLAQLENFKCSKETHLEMVCGYKINKREKLEKTQLLNGFDNSQQDLVKKTFFGFSGGKNADTNNNELDLTKDILAMGGTSWDRTFVMEIFRGYGGYYKDFLVEGYDRILNKDLKGLYELLFEIDPKERANIEYQATDMARAIANQLSLQASTVTTQLALAQMATKFFMEDFKSNQYYSLLVKAKDSIVRKQTEVKKIKQIIAEQYSKAGLSTGRIRSALEMRENALKNELRSIRSIIIRVVYFVEELLKDLNERMNKVSNPIIKGLYSHNQISHALLKHINDIFNKALDIPVFDPNSADYWNALERQFTLATMMETNLMYKLGDVENKKLVIDRKKIGKDEPKFENKELPKYFFMSKKDFRDNFKYDLGLTPDEKEKNRKMRESFKEFTLFHTLNTLLVIDFGKNIEATYVINVFDLAQKNNFDFNENYPIQSKIGEKSLLTTIRSELIQSNGRINTEILEKVCQQDYKDKSIKDSLKLLGHTGNEKSNVLMAKYIYNMNLIRSNLSKNLSTLNKDIITNNKGDSEILFKKPFLVYEDNNILKLTKDEVNKLNANQKWREYLNRWISGGKLAKVKKENIPVCINEPKNIKVELKMEGQNKEIHANFKSRIAKSILDKVNVCKEDSRILFIDENKLGSLIFESVNSGGNICNLEINLKKYQEYAKEFSVINTQGTSNEGKTYTLSIDQLSKTDKETKYIFDKENVLKMRGKFGRAIRFWQSRLEKRYGIKEDDLIGGSPDERKKALIKSSIEDKGKYQIYERMFGIISPSYYFNKKDNDNFEFKVFSLPSIVGPKFINLEDLNIILYSSLDL